MEALVWIYFIGVSIVALSIGYAAISFLVYVIGIPLIAILKLIGIFLILFFLFGFIISRG